MLRESSTALCCARNDVSAVLLAGGESRRMGRDKATVSFRGKPLWQIQLETVRNLKPVEILVSARTDPVWRPHDILFVADIPPSRGPLSGLAASIERITTSHLLALAIDMPQMTGTYLKFLYTQIEPGCGVVPKIDNRAEPLAAIYPREAASEFRSALRSAEFSLQSVTRDLAATGKLREIAVPEQQTKLFLNFNAQDELRRS
jgi:molybdopterin-guanine dinucleotide biosynthesis protein A